jgi:putative ABC transport system permease protein
MSLPIRPILSALSRNSTGAVLVAMQIAIALAVLVNAVYIVKQRVEKIGRPTGLDVENTFAIAGTGFARDYDHDATLREDIAWLQSIPGVVAATPITAVPLSGGGSASGLSPRPGGSESGFQWEVGDGNYFEVNEQGLTALGAHLIAGRNFRADEILQAPATASGVFPSVIMTQAYADRLLPGGHALDAIVYDYLSRPVKIIGIMDNIHGSWPTEAHPDRVYLMPRFPAGPRFTYFVRTRPGERDKIMRQAEEHLSSSNPRRSINWVRSLQQFKDQSYLRDRNMGIFLVAVTTLLLGITALGIFGLATFTINTRTKQIGTRRAVGARRRDIVAHFMTENWIITSVGVFAGCLTALGVGYWLSQHYELPRLDLYYLIGGVLGMWALGLLAAWQPSRRAAKISPAVAARTV